MHNLNNRLDVIESQLAFQEDAIEQFNVVFVDQQRQIQELRSQLSYLQELLNELADASLGAEVDPAQDKPPHY